MANADNHKPEDLKKIIIQLENSEQQLVALNQQLEASNQQLLANEQQLRAYNQQLEANDQQLRAANQQLIASEKTLKYEKEFSDSLVETANTIIVTLDADANITLFNKFAEELTGYKKEEVLGKNWFGLFISKSNGSTIPKVFHDVLIDVPEASSHTNPILIKDGSERLISWENTIIKNDNGEISGILSIGNDITERKQTEQDIVQKNEQLELILQGGNLGWWDWDIPSGKEIYNEILAESLGYKLSNIEPHISWWEDKIHPDDLKQVRSDLQEHFDGKTDYYTNNHRLKTKSGEWKWFMDHGKVVKWDEDGKPIRMIGILRDIDKLERSVATLRESEEKYRLITTNTLDTIWTTDLNFNMTFVNSAIINSLGYTPEEFSGLNPSVFTTKESMKNLQNAAEQLVARYKEGDAIQNIFEVQQIKKDGSLIDVEIRANVLLDNKENIVGFQGRSVDITERKKAEKELKESEDRFEAFMNYMPAGIFIKDSDGHYLFSNKFNNDRFDISNVEGKTAYDFFAKEIADEFTKDDNRVLNGENLVIEGSVIDKNDQLLYYKNHQFAIEQSDGKKLIGGISFDITKEKKAEEEIRKLSTAVHQSPSVIAITDLEGNLEYVNPKFTELTGYTFEEAKGLNPKVLKSGKQPDHMYKELWQTISSGKEWHGEFHNKKKNGELFWEIASVSPIFDKQGKITNYIKVAEDISERKRAEQVQKVMYNISNAVSTTKNVEELINQIQIELGTIIDTTNFYVAFYDDKTDMLSLPYYSDEKDKFTSAPAAKTLTKYVIDTKKPLLADVKLKKKLVEEGLLIHQGSFSRLWLGVPLKTEGKVTGVFAVQSYTDENAFSESDMKMLEFISGQISISIERKKAEEKLITALEKATESERLKTAFLNNFSHEIRTPMNGILGFVSLLKQPNLTGDQKESFINIIETSSDRMLVTVDDLVNISMIESGQMKVSNSEININEQVENIESLLKIEARKKGLQLVLKNSLPANEANIITDNAKIYGVITNLVKNAIKFTHEGSVKFGLTKKGDNLEFFVEDTGIGVPNDRQQAIFDRFVKADIEDKDVFEGSGLGLTIAKAYVEMLGGNLWLESEEGIGSKFYFTIPYNPVKKELAKSEVNKSRMKSDSLPNPLTILIVEDEEVSAEYLSIILSETDATLLLSKTGEETIEIVRNNPDIDIVLMDIKMPGMSGYEATKQIRKFNDEVVIIAQTAYALKGDREKAIDVGCNDYIAKPINKDVLFELIASWT